MNVVQVESTFNSVTVEATETTVDAETIDVMTTYYYITPSQTLPEHREVET